jgi:outer membrane protein
LQARLNLAASYIKLNRVVGLPLDAKVKLRDSLGFVMEKFSDEQGLIVLAGQSRIELKIAGQRLKRDMFKLNAVNAQWLPRLDVFGNYGLEGSRPNNSAVKVGAAGLSLTMPIFESGLISGKAREASGKVQQSRLAYYDLDRQVQEDARLASRILKISSAQVKAAKKVFFLANKELRMSRDQFGAGIGDNIEVVRAQAVLAGARQKYVAALFEYHTSRVNFYSAMGNIKEFKLAKNKADN